MERGPELLLEIWVGLDDGWGCLLALVVYGVYVCAFVYEHVDEIPLTVTRC